MDNPLTFSSSFLNQATLEKVDEDEVSSEKNSSLNCILCETGTAFCGGHTSTRLNSLSFVSH